MGFFSKLFKKSANDVIYPAAKGEYILLSDLNDGVFSNLALGDGLAVKFDVADDGTFYSPVDGEINLIFPTKHAVGITTKKGANILLHVGIDTVNLQGDGFEIFVKEGQKVLHGDKIGRIDLEKVKNAGYRTECITLVLPETGNYKLKNLNEIKTGDKLELENPVFEIELN
ncbi:PTS sugar transporter subunit IIA [Mycoplasma hafezii]|uniref:PTS sugar transporter subunit IIA n=1 Tax=Mycoplasma hafezii TaxID=525886 RepID=UPI003CEF81D9